MLEGYLVRGLKAGLVAGVALGLFVALLANPMIGAAEQFAGEGDHDHGTHADGGHAEHEAGGAGDSGLLSVLTAETVGVLGGVFWGLLLGVGFGLAFYVLEPALPGAAAGKSALVAAGGFVTVSGAPWLVLPPQPPGVEQTLATDTRLLLYAGLMLAGLAACLAAGYVSRRLRSLGRGPAALGAAVPLCLLVVLAALAPAAPVEQAVPASLVAAFRAQVVFGQLLVWTLLAAAHARLLRREADGTATEFPDLEDPTPD